MTILNDKDALRLETIRFFTENDPYFWSIDNRPLQDLEERTIDLDAIHKPSREFRVRQEIPASADVEIESGNYVSGGTTIVQYAGTTITIPAATAGQIRIDLIWFNLRTGAAVRTAGAEVAAAVTFVGATRPTIPANDGAVPLAYIYVNDVPTPFDETIAINNAGHIQDVRPGPGFNPGYLFENSAATFLSDVTGGSVGTASTIARANHRHPLNATVDPPSSLNPAKAAAAGTAGTYALLDHIHLLDMETNPANLLADGVAAVGASNRLVGAAHKHPSNVGSTVPALVAAATGVAGTSLIYAREDHTHQLDPNLVKTVEVITQTASAFTLSITLTAGTWLVFVMGFYHQSSYDDTTLTLNGSAVQTTVNFGDQAGTGYVMLMGTTTISGAGSYNMQMSSNGNFSGGGPRMLAIAFKLSAS